MLLATELRPFLQRLFPGGCGDPVDLQALEARLQIDALQLRHVSLPLPPSRSTPGAPTAAAAASPHPPLLVLHEGSARILVPHVDPSHPGGFIMRQSHLTAHRHGLLEAFGATYHTPQLPDRLHYAYAYGGRLHLWASHTHSHGEVECGTYVGDLPGIKIHPYRWDLEALEGPLPPCCRDLLAACVDEASGDAYLLDGQGQLHRCRGPERTWAAVGCGCWPLHRAPLGMRVHAGKLLALALVLHANTPDTVRPPELQMWQLGASGPPHQWQLVKEASMQLPAGMHDGCLAAPYQGRKWMVSVQPPPGATSPPDAAAAAEAAAAVRPATAAAAAAPAAQPAAAPAAQPAAAAQPAEAAAEQPGPAGPVLALILDCDAFSWSAPLCTLPSRPADLIRPRRQGNPRVTSAAFFQQPAAGAATGSALHAAAKAAVDPLGPLCAALSSHWRQWHARHEGAHWRRQQREAIAFLQPTAGGVTAVWRSWVLPPARLGEIAAPEFLLYDLRQAAAARAAAAALTAGSDGSSSACVCGSSVLLRVAADSSLPPIRCPPSVARQCGELARLLEVLRESATSGAAAAGGTADAAAAASSSCEAGGSGGSGGGSTCQRLQQLCLLGVALEEHGALHQLVRCLAGEMHAGLLEATQLLDVMRLADLLDAPALLSECIAVLECITPGPEMFAPLLALAEARQYNADLQRLKIFYKQALVLHILQGHDPILRWVLHGLQAGVDTIVEACAEVAILWLPCQADCYLGTPGGDLEALACPAWQAAAQQQQADRLQPLLAALLSHWSRMLVQASGGHQAGAAGQAGKKARVAAAGPFQSAAFKPQQQSNANTAQQQALPAPALLLQLERVLQQLQRTLPRQQAQRRREHTAAAFQQAEARAKRQRQLITVDWMPLNGAGIVHGGDV